MATTRSAAHQLVEKKFSSMTLPSIYWPTVPHADLAWEIDSRIDNPNRIWQALSNLCGMASFFSSLATDDPYLYAFYVCEMYRCGAAYLGYGKKAPLVQASKTTRGSPMPPMMPSADWVALASLRDHLNGTLHYAFDLHVPVLKEIPILGFFGQPSFLEPISAINFPNDLCNAFRAVGYTKVVNRAHWSNRATFERIGEANGYFKAGYNVLLLINSGMADADVGVLSLTADHWVRLATPIEVKQEYVRCWVYDPQKGETHWLPESADYLHRNTFLGHYYGFIATKR